MARERNSDRLFTEKETAKILRRAADIQVASGSGRSDRDGVSPDELLRIGQEVGLDESSLRQAMASLEDDGDEAQTRWLGAPPSYETERVMEGPFSDRQWQAIVGELNSSFQQSIEGVTAGPVRTWHWKHDLGSVHFTATESANAVRLKIVAFIDDGVSLGMILTIIGMLASVATVWSVDSLRPWIAILASVLVVGVISAWFRRTVSNWWRRDRRKMSRLMDRVEQSIRSESGEGSARPALTDDSDEVRTRLSP